MHIRSRFEVHTGTLVAGVRGTEFIVETTDSQQTDVGVFEGEIAVSGINRAGNRIEESEVVVTQGNQTTVQRNKLPLRPFALKKRMLVHKKVLEILRKKAVDRRLNLLNIIKKRVKAREQILKRWKKIRQEKSKRIKRLKKRTRRRSWSPRRKAKGTR